MAGPIPRSVYAFVLLFVTCFEPRTFVAASLLPGIANKPLGAFQASNETANNTLVPFDFAGSRSADESRTEGGHGGLGWPDDQSPPRRPFQPFAQGDSELFNDAMEQIAGLLEFSVEYQKFMSDDGLLNEFAMMWALREDFPLHFILFKQTASHLPHEANVEQIFSRAGLLSDPNFDPVYLAILVKVAFNKKAFTPPLSAIKDKYYEMCRGKGNVEQEIMETAPAAAAAVAAAGAGPSSLVETEA